MQKLFLATFVVSIGWSGASYAACPSPCGSGICVSQCDSSGNNCSDYCSSKLPPQEASVSPKTDIVIKMSKVTPEAAMAIRKLIEGK